MNTKASVAYGWGVLILAGGGAYYFAKRSINADRSERAASIERDRQNLQRIRQAEYTGSSAASTKQDPSTPGSDPAPTSHQPAEPIPRSKYEAEKPFRSRKGDRFS